MPRVTRLTSSVLIVSLFFVCIGFPILQFSTKASSEGQLPDAFQVWEGDGGAYLYYASDGEVFCRPASMDEARSINDRDPNLPLQILADGGISPHVGDVNFVLRSTTQLDNFPLAKEGFLKAAAIWKSRIRTPQPITIIVDVDFGPTRFGEPYPNGILGSTGAQPVLLESGYANVRAQLQSTASSAEETALYNTLPTGIVPTDIGATSAMVVTTPLLRTLGLINAIADPPNEPTFGSPPSIGFNSNFTYDFDPSNGIDVDKFDFEALAVHELGHVLGFNSFSGNKESRPSDPIVLSVWDLFRFRPGVTTGNFMTRQRVLSSGGDHVFFDGSITVPVSTGRPNGSGGDGFQPSHWKNNTFVGQTIGIMDPALARGERNVITDNDLRVLNLLGYLLIGGGGGGSNSPLIQDAQGSLTGDTLVVSGTVSDLQGDVTMAHIDLINGNGNVVLPNVAFAVSLGGLTTASFQLTMTGLNRITAAVAARLVFTDAQGNRSSSVDIRFDQADAGAPTLTKVNFTGSKLVLKGVGLSGQVLIEINGIVVVNRNNSSAKKIKINGDAADLNIRNGSNRFRVIKDGLRSNIEVRNF